jgi:hypothetical protein
MFSVIFITF